MSKERFFLALRFSSVCETYRQEVCESWDEALLSLSADSLKTKEVWPHSYIAEDGKVKWAVSGTEEVLGMSPAFANDYFQQNRPRLGREEANE